MALKWLKMALIGASNGVIRHLQLVVRKAHEASRCAEPGSVEVVGDDGAAYHRVGVWVGLRQGEDGIGLVHVTAEVEDLRRDRMRAGMFRMGR